MSLFALICAVLVAVNAGAIFKGDEGACDPATRPRVLTTPGAFASQGYPLAYQPNSHCEWVFISNVPGDVPSVAITDMGVEPSTDCVYDYIEFFDGPDANAPLISRHCGIQLPPAVAAPSGSLFMRFMSNEINEREPGFRGAFSIQDAACTPAQPKVLTEPRGAISSPNHPGMYPHNADCSWHIMAPVNQTISFNVTSFALETGCCLCDRMRVFDGDSTAAPVLGNFCADNTVPPLRSTSNNMFIIFISDTSVANTGFTSNYLME